MNRVALLLLLTVTVAAAAEAAPGTFRDHSNSAITLIREACGAGYHMVNGSCVRTAARRNAARCAVGMRTVGGRCVK